MHEIASVRSRMTSRPGLLKIPHSIFMFFIINKIKNSTWNKNFPPVKKTEQMEMKSLIDQGRLITVPASQVSQSSTLIPQMNGSMKEW